MVDMNQDNVLQKIPEIAQFDLEYREMEESQREQFCHQFLIRFAEKEQNVKRDFELSAYVYSQLAQLLECNRRSVSDIDHVLKQAIEHACNSENHSIKYHTFFIAGCVMSRYKIDQGISLLQRALLCADYRFPDQFVSVISVLADFWSMNSSTYENALLMFDWISIIVPAPIHNLQTKYLCMIRNGDLETVKLTSSLTLIEDCNLIGKVVAARLACRRYKAAYKAAEYGLEVSRSLQQSEWERAFLSVIRNKSKSKP